jgi:porphobilinogen synthase
MFPLNRNRRLRQSPAVRALVRETSLSPANFIAPIFVVEGRQVREEIPSMPNYYRLSLDLVSAEVKSLWSLGIKSVLVFVKVPDVLKDNRGTEAVNPQGLMQRAVAEIKSTCPDMVVMTDVALDPYSVHGHDGIVEGSAIVNDPTVEVLTQMALSHIEAGADFVAPSDMMDGRVLRIRQAFEAAGHTHAGILSYSAKYASAYYGPFRDALDSAPGFGDKKTYQMDYANRREAIVEAQNDIDEGADIIMVKPGLCYLDIVRELRDAVEVPIAAYQVSGEYAQLKAAAQKGWLDHDAVMIEQLYAFKRAGADLIATYFAADAARLL